MGLDVYLRRNRAECEAADALPYPEWKKWRDANPDLPSTAHPDHLFKRTYLRSSYNSGGFNSVMANWGLPDLYYIFGVHDEDVDCSNMALQKAKLRAEELVRQLREKFAKPVYRVATISHNHFTGLASVTAEGAVQVLEAELARHANNKSPFGGSYSNRDGHFFLDSQLKVVAAVPGISVLKEPCVHLLYEAPEARWYLEAAEVVVEFCDQALQWPNRYIVWSG